MTRDGLPASLPHTGPYNARKLVYRAYERTYGGLTGDRGNAITILMFLPNVCGRRAKLHRVEYCNTYISI